MATQPSGSLSAIILTTLAGILLSYVYAWIRLRHVPGPFLARFSNLWLTRVTVEGAMGDRLVELKTKYGDLVRIGPNDLLTSNGDVIRKMHAVRSDYTRSEWYNAMRFDPYKENIASERDTQKHDQLRAKMASGYSGRENPSLEADIDGQLAAFLALIRKKYISKGSQIRPMDFSRKVQYFTMDAIGKVAYGNAFGYLEKDEDVYEYLQTTEKVVFLMELCANVPMWQKFFMPRWLLSLVGPSANDKQGVGKMMGVAKDIVQARLSSGKDGHQNMLGSFLSHGMAPSQAESEILLQILAGSETTATAVRATVLFLIATPVALRKLQTEIDEGIRKGTISDPITHSEAKRLVYLQACIKEGLRMHPPFNGLSAKTVPRHGDVLLGYQIPGGTRVGVNYWGVQRDTEIYGADAVTFRPERWLEADDQKLSEMERTYDLIFSYGRFGCLGRQVAYVELNKILVELFRNFDISVMNPGKPWNSVNYNIFIQHDFWLRFSERERDEESGTK